VQRDGNGDLQADPKGFPNGFRPVADYLHSVGLKFGVYTDRGTQTCGGRAAAFGHEAQDAAWYAKNGFDYVKEDSCNAVQDHSTAYHEYSLMRDGLNATGAPIVFSLCGWEKWYAPVGAALGNLWRTGPDDTNWAGVLTNLDIISPLAPFAGPGGWNDPCLLLGHDSTGRPAVTDVQGRAQFSMWAIVAAPMLLSQDILNWTAYQVETYTNAEVIAVGQDELGKPGYRLVGGPLSPGGDGNTPLTVGACAGTTSQQWKYNSPAASFLTNVASNQCINVDDCGNDLILFDCVTTGGTCAGPSSYANEEFTFSGGAMQSAMGNLCVTNGGDGQQTMLAPCGVKGQTWSYIAARQTIEDGAGNCLTAGTLNNAAANVWGRQLADGSWALAFINAGPAAVDLACDATCLAVTGWEPEQVLAVRDLWGKQNLPPVNGSTGIAVSGLAADGGIALFRVTPTF